MAMYGLNKIIPNRKQCYAYKNLAFGGYLFDKCTSCGRQTAIELPPTQTDAFVLDGGKQYTDFLFFGGSGLYFLVSKNVLSAFQKYGVTGYEQAIPVPLYREKQDALIEQEAVYYLLNITGSIDLDLKAMALKRKHVCPVCKQFDWSRQRLYTIKSVFDMSTWNQSDLCRLASFPGYIVCSEKVKSIVEEYGFSGVSFQNEDRIFQL